MKAFLPDQTHISQVRLRTAHLGALLNFYTAALGLKVLDESSSHATLSCADNGPALLVLTEDPAARPRRRQSAGLHHFAFRFSGRQGLRRAYARMKDEHRRMVSACDHGVSEAIYLNDPDGNGVELYVDRPPERWRWRDGQVAMASRPLDLNRLLENEASQEEPGQSAERMAIGHIHLCVRALEAAELFYREFLGLAVTQRSDPGPLLFAAGGYHHHIGVEVGADRRTPPANSASLVSFRIEVPCPEILYCLGHRAPLLGYETRSGSEGEVSPVLQIREPSGSWLEIQTSTASSPDPHSAPACSR